jgi:hypothetical protein
MTVQDDLDRIARDVIDANSYMTIATADDSGLPWPSPVWYAHAGYQEFFWVSSTEARHSRNLAARPEAGIVIYDSHVPAGTAQAVYMSVAAAEAAAGEFGRGLDVYSTRSLALGLRRWTADDVRAPAALRLYRASVTELFVMDGVDERMPAAPGG